MAAGPWTSGGKLFRMAADGTTVSVHALAQAASASVSNESDHNQFEIEWKGEEGLCAILFVDAGLFTWQVVFS